MSRKGRTNAEGDRALLLRRTPFGNSSLVIHVLTPNRGRVELIAKGAYRTRSRFAGVLDWFDTLDLEWTVKNPMRTASRSSGATGLSPLISGDLAVRRRALTRGLASYRAAQTVVELMDLATRTGAADADLFTLFEQSLDALDLSVASNDSDGLAVLLTAGFELQLLGALGLEPALRTCAVCGGPAPPAVGVGTPAARAPFSATAGGRLCDAHAREVHSQGARVGTLPVRLLEAAAMLARTPAAQLAPGARTDRTEDLLRGLDPGNILDFTGRFLDHHLETRPRSHARFLAAPDRNRRSASPRTGSSH